MFLRHGLGFLSLRLRVLLLAPLVLLATPARAEIWGYAEIKVADSSSSLQRDEDYGIFFRSAEGFDQGKENRRIKKRIKKTGGTPRRLTYFEHAPRFTRVNRLIREASVAHGVDYELLQAVIAVESGFRIRVVSPKGAIGLMQVIPPTAERYGVKDDKYSLVEDKLINPKINIQTGSRHLNKLIKRYPGDIELALAAYNAGEGAVRRAGNKIPNYPETKNYVKNVMRMYEYLKPPPRPSVAASAGHRARVEKKLSLRKARSQGKTLR